jgi:uncharacterized lipoprotein YehR (DUF1307 family)
MKKVVRNSFWGAMILMVALTGCTKDDAYSTGTGLVKVNGNEYSITKAYVSDISPYYGSGYSTNPYSPGDAGKLRISFFTKENGSSIVSITMTDSELTSKTYTTGEGGIDILVLAPYYEYYDFDAVNVVMVVDKSGDTYDITITGKTSLEENEYTITYKGTIRTDK